MKGTGRANATANSRPRIRMRLARGWASLTSSLRKMVVRMGWGISYGNTPDGAGPTPVGVGWNPLSFSSTSFGEPAVIFGAGLPYTTNDIFAINMSPGIRPQAGQINNPPTYMDRNAGRPPRINQWNIAMQREITPNIVR